MYLHKRCPAQEFAGGLDDCRYRPAKIVVATGRTNCRLSRPYRKNDQAWIEQKNGAVVRHFVGHDRYSGAVAGQTMAHLYGAVRQYVNYFQPSFKLVEKTRHGSRVVKRYSPPATPCDRLMQHVTRSA